MSERDKSSQEADAELSAKCQYNFSRHEQEVLRRQMALCVKLSGGMLNLGITIRRKLAIELEKAKLDYLFTMPPKVLAFMFMRSIDTMLTVVDRPDDLMEQIYNLGINNNNNNNK